MAATLGFPEENSFALRPWRALPPRALLPWLLAGAGGLLLLSIALMWNLWMSDALRSIGMYFPLVSVLLTWRAWRATGWEARGTWWGLPPVLYALATARAAGNTGLAIALTARFNIPLLPVGLTLFAFASGVVLLLGGARVWRKAAFPLALLLFVNPVPKLFSLFDLPLQYASAYVARSAAVALGVHLSGDQLKLMFSPDFGMFIAPGCNGLRGAVTLGYLALVAGYVYRFSRAWRVISVAGAVAAGYLFNLLRLCVLVLFYWAALRIPSLQEHGEGADYMIGACLFLTAAILLGSLVRWKKRAAAPEILEGESRPAGGPWSMRWKGAMVCAAILLAMLPYGQQVLGAGEAKAPAARLLPEAIGDHKLQHTWMEEDSQNQVTYRWGAYSVPGEPRGEIDLALWFGEYLHYPLQCHLYRGDRPAWEERSVLRTASGETARFMLDFYQDAEGVTLEATTVCSSNGCSETVSMPSESGVMFTSTGMKNYFFHSDAKPVPVLVRLQGQDAGESLEVARVRMTEQLKNFVAAMDSGRIAAMSAPGS